MNYLIELPLFLMLMPEYTYGVIYLVISYPLFCLLWRYWGRKYCFSRKLTVQKRSLAISIMITCFLAFSFQERWVSSSKVGMLANLLHLPAQTLVALVNAVLAVLSVVAVDRILNELWNLKRLKFPKLFQKMIKRDSCLIVEVFLLDGFILWFSCFRSIQEGVVFSNYLIGEAGLAILFLLVNLFLLYVLALLFCVIVKGWRNALSLGGIILLIWCIANHYVVLLHGSPLILSELRSFKTAMEVAGGYKFSVDTVVICLIVLLSIRFALVRMIPAEQKAKELVFRRAATLAGCILVLMMAEYVSDVPPFTWLWKRDVTVQGFSFCVLQDAIRLTNPYKQPQGYDASQLVNVQTDSSLPKVLPDIILVLNESFSDLCDMYQLQVDKNPLSEFYNVEGAFFGKACASEIGGGTNNSEFELLTSMSMYLLNSVAPFNYVDFTAMDAHCVSYLEQFGYHKRAMHFEAANYSRDKAYPAMGFDETVLGQDAFSYNGMNGSRFGLDMEHYKELIERTDKQSEAPQFSYLLTYQNHGGYEQNEDVMDTVHVQGDYGSLTDDLNEYLSSVQLSAEAFHFLTDYYLKQDRPVIICMVGDHQPSFVPDLPLDGLSEEEEALQRRIVPFAIWANFEADFSDIPEWISMTDLVPTLLHTAGIPLSSYYQKLLSLQKLVPVRNGSGIMLDSNGNVFEFDKGCEYYEHINEVFCMEYNALIGGADYRKDLFFLTDQQ